MKKSLLDIDWEEIDKTLIGPTAKRRTKREGIYEVPSKTISYEALSEQGISTTHS